MMVALTWENADFAWDSELGLTWGDEEFEVIDPDPPVLTTITVSPATVIVAAGGTQQFTASQLDQYGEPIDAGNVEWSVDGDGSIDDSGLYTAAATAGSDVVTAMIDGVVGTASVTVAAMTISRSPLIPRPARSRRLQLFTLASAVDHLLRMDEINPNESRSVERAVAACQSALGSFVSYSTQGFRYFQSRAKIVMPGRVPAGAITVSSGVVTPSESLPDWIDLATLRLGNHGYPVLASGSGVFYVGSELQDGEYSGAMLEQIFYPLPANFRRRGTLTDRTNVYAVGDVHAGSLQGMEDYFQWVSSTGAERSFSAVTADSRYQGSLLLAVWPAFGVRTELNLFYERYPDPVEVHREGGVGLTISGTSATTEAPFFTERHLGAALAVGIDNSTEFYRSLSSPSLLDSQRVIVEVVSSTEATIDAPVEGSVSDRSFYVSDVVDVMQGPMRDAFMRLCEYEIMRQSNSKIADRKYREFMSQMHVAMADDMRYRDSIDEPGAHWGGIHIGSVNVRPE